MNNELKEIDIKSYIYYYFDDINNINDLNIDNILINEKSYENILIYNVVHKTLYGAKSLRIIFDKVDGYIRKNDNFKYVALFDIKYKVIFDRIRYPIMLKSNISDAYFR